jgi:mannobiose 2-epimerase
MGDSGVQNLRERVEAELRSNILPFWVKHTVDDQYGGFRGQISNDLTIDPLAPKGLILNARILWTFSKAYSVYHNEVYLEMAHRAFDYITRYFWDTESGGVFWMADYLGRPLETEKRIYGQAFTVYSLAEFRRATGDPDALAKALQIYEAIESASYDALHRGYFETYERDWTLAQDQRLSKVDMDAKKSMNTHLHLLEAYANLLRCHNHTALRTRLKELIHVFLDHIIDRRTHHFRMFFDEEWHSQSDHISFGHDIEGSWLLCEAAEILGDQPILKAVRQEALLMAQAVLDQGVDSDGGLLYEGNASGIIDTDKHWWPQAEAVVAFLNAYQLSGQEQFLVAAGRSWEFIEKFIVDREHGEWFWRVSRAGVPSDKEFKVDPWKCPYHNSRTCFEVMTRLDNLGHVQGSPAETHIPAIGE